jgi:hypothetical protein
MKTYTLDVSRIGIIRSQRYQFTRPTTFLTEALQNSRRAAATAVWLEWASSPRCMTIRDNGIGIRDFTKLFLVGESGWNADIVAQENPFGVGFMAAVLASERIWIRTLDREVQFETRDLLNFCPVEDRAAHTTMTHGTEIRLTLHHDLEPPSFPDIPVGTPDPINERWHKTITYMVKGFPIPVYFNGKPLPRPHALNSGLIFFETEVGQFHLKGWQKCEPSDNLTGRKMYYQGLPICINTYSELATDDILHLDQSLPVRMPDRDTLLDAERQKQRIDATEVTLWRKRLVELYSQMHPQAFIDQYWRLCVRLRLPDLLRDAPLSASMLRRYIEPVSLYEHDNELTNWTTPSLPTSHDIFITRLDGYHAGDYAPPAPLASIYAIERRLPVLNQKVPEGHWASKLSVSLLNEDLRIGYEIHGSTRSGTFKGSWVWCKVIVCESFTIQFSPTVSCNLAGVLRIRLHPTTVTNWAFYDPKENCIVVPADVQHAGYAVKQVSDYTDGDDGHYDEGACEADQAALHSLVESLRANSPHAYLEALLRDVSVDPNLLGDHTYEIRVSSDRSRLTVIKPD